MVDLVGLYKTTAKGRDYYYAWRNGPRIKAAHGTPAFAAEFAAHHAARKGGDKAKVVGLIVDWKKSEAWTAAPEKGGMAASTRKNWKGPLDTIQREFGDLPVLAFDDTQAARKRIKRWRSKWTAQPRTADMHKQVLSALLSFAVEEDRLTSNPCIGIKNLYGNDRSDLIWRPEDIMQMAGHAPPEIMFALGLGCLTGLRQSDLFKLCWNHIDDLAITMRVNKGTVRGKGMVTVEIPLYDELRALLAVIPRVGPRVLTNTEGQPWKSGFTSSWRKAKLAAGIDELHFHDSRGTAATALYEAKALTLAEIATFMGWSEEKVERIINRYVNRDALLRDKIRRIDEARNADRTGIAKPSAKPS